MANTKRFQGLGNTGLTLFFEAWNEAGNFCDNADGDFRFPPADYLLPATEIGTTGVYYRDENRVAWIDGIVNYRLVDALGVVYSTGGQIETVNDYQVNDTTIFKIIRNQIASLVKYFVGLFGRSQGGG